MKSQHFSKSLLAVSLSSALTVLALGAVGTANAARIPLTLDAAEEYLADEENRVSAGAQFQTESSGSTSGRNQWNGLNHRSNNAVVDANYAARDRESGWSVDAKRLGTSIPEVDVEWNNYGTLKVEAGVQRFRHLTNENSMVLPAGKFPESDTVEGVTAALVPTDVEQVRDVYELDTVWRPASAWRLSADYELQHRKGNQLTNSFEHRGATTNQRQIEYSLDEEHHRLDLAAQWADKTTTSRFSYKLSHFENHNPFVVSTMWKAPKPDNGLNEPAAARYAVPLDPSSTMHTASWDGTHVFGGHTVVSGALAYSWLDPQDPVYDGNEGTQGVQAYRDWYVNELDYIGRVDMPSIDLAVTSSAFDNWRLKASYGWRRYDQSMDRLPYAYFGDKDQSGDLLYAWRDPNHTIQKLKGSAAYSFGGGLSTRFYANWKRKDYAQVVDTVESWTLGGEVRQRMSSALSGKAGYAYTKRTADDWMIYGRLRNFTNPDVDAGTVEEIGGTADFRSYNKTPWAYAAYDEHALYGSAATQLTDALTLSGTTRVYTRSYNRDGVEDTLLNGMQKANGQSVSLDLDWTVSRNLSLYAFYGFDRLKNDVGQTYSPQEANLVGHPQDDLVLWGKTKSTDITHTLGLGFDWHPEAKPVELSAQYVLSFDSTRNGSPWKYHQDGYQTSQGKLTDTDFGWIEDASYRTHYLEGRVTWHATKSWDVTAWAAYERATSSDIKWSGEAMSSTVLDLRQSDNWSDALVYVGVTYKLP